jgi:hypothetical protein
LIYLLSLISGRSRPSDDHAGRRRPAGGGAP